MPLDPDDVRRVVVLRAPVERLAAVLRAPVERLAVLLARVPVDLVAAFVVAAFARVPVDFVALLARVPVDFAALLARVPVDLARVPVERLLDERVADFAVPNFDCGEAARLDAVPPVARRTPSSAPTRSASCSTCVRSPLSSSTTLMSSSVLRMRWAAPVISSTRSVARPRTASAPDCFLDFFFFLSAMVARLYSWMPETIHLRTHAPVAERVLLPGDPGRALRLAQALTDAPKMLNHNRGLWGYTGVAPDGEPLTIQSTGMGGPSAAIVVEELITLGARRLIRVGTCGALNGDLAIGDLVRADRVVGIDGTSRALGAELAPDAGLTAALDAPGVTAVTTDLFYDDDLDLPGDVVEMESAAVLAVAALRGVRAAVLLAVSDTLAGGRHRICEEHLHAVELRLGELALAALPAERG